MAIVPQISSVQPNTEVRSVSRSIQSPLGVNASLSDIQTFIDETSLGGQTQVTFQQGTYTASGEIEIPSNTYVILMNGAFLPDVDFVDDQGDPSENVIDLNILASGAGGGAGVVFNIESDETVALGSSFSLFSPASFISGIAKVGVALDGNQNEVLLNNSTGSDGSRDFDGIEVDQNSILARTGSDLDSFSVPSNSLLVREGSDLTTFSFGSNKVLSTDGSNNLQDVSVDQNSLVLREGASSISGFQVGTNSVLIRDGGDLKSEKITNGQFLANTGGGLEATNLNAVSSDLDLDASDIASGTFASTGGGVTYEFNSNLTVTDVGTFKAGAGLKIKEDSDGIGLSFDLIESTTTTPKIRLKASNSEVDIQGSSVDIAVKYPSNPNIPNVGVNIGDGGDIEISYDGTTAYEISERYIQANTISVQYDSSNNGTPDTNAYQENVPHYVQISRTGVVAMPVFKNDAIESNEPGTTDQKIDDGGLQPPDGHASLVFQDDGGLILSAVDDQGNENGV